MEGVRWQKIPGYDSARVDLPGDVGIVLATRTGSKRGHVSLECVPGAKSLSATEARLVAAAMLKLADWIDWIDERGGG